MVTKWKKSYYFLIFHPISFSSKGNDCQYIFIMFPLLKLFQMYFCTHTLTKKSSVIHHRLFLFYMNTKFPILVISTLWNSAHCSWLNICELSNHIPINADLLPTFFSLSTLRVVNQKLLQKYLGLLL